MTDFVLDASVTLAWCFPDEETLETRALLTHIRASAARAPVIWPLEVANVLLIAERRQRLTQLRATQFIQFLHALPITVDTDRAMGAFGPVLSLGRTHGLSAYDAAYLELALRHGLPLATQDERLRVAASLVGVPLL